MSFNGSFSWPVLEGEKSQARLLKVDMAKNCSEEKIGVGNGLLFSFTVQYIYSKSKTLHLQKCVLSRFFPKGGRKWIYIAAKDGANEKNRTITEHLNRGISDQCTVCTYIACMQLKKREIFAFFFNHSIIIFRLFWPWLNPGWLVGWFLVSSAKPCLPATRGGPCKFR